MSLDFDPFLYKNGIDFLNKTKFTHEEAILFLDSKLEELEKRCKRDECRGDYPIPK